MHSSRGVVMDIEVCKSMLVEISMKNISQNILFSDCSDGSDEPSSCGKLEPVGIKKINDFHTCYRCT